MNMQYCTYEMSVHGKLWEVIFNDIMQQERAKRDKV